MAKEEKTMEEQLNEDKAAEQALEAEEQEAASAPWSFHQEYFQRTEEGYMAHKEGMVHQRSRRFGGYRCSGHRLWPDRPRSQRTFPYAYQRCLT